MKKYLVAILAIMLCGVFQAGAAVEKTPGERSLCNQIKEYLQDKGYDVAFDNVGDLMISHDENTPLYLSVKEYNEGYYVNCFGNLDAKDLNRCAMLEACSRVSSKSKFLRCYMYSTGTVFFGCDGYFTNFYQLKAVLVNYFDTLREAEHSLLEYYDLFNK